ncbi:Caspase activity and apoptosis inhibitor 1 [Merluccius polli]|uniref:Caspase activity and apoptosis inhibitor 1 n=1 Tax=Merluccius polli TaxID=89951 RepID=A0AA47P7C8_MERPO|nr:Caspase activity and apoptosis inhibitor 1 [Merluccius polli]
MLKSKAGSKEKKRKHAATEEQHGVRRRVCTESSLEDSKDELADAELDRIGSDMEEGGLDLSLPFQPISAYATDRQEMLEQCFQVLGEKKLQKMLPDELKSCPLEEIKKMCLEQLEQLSQRNLLQILGGEELTSGDEDMGAEATSTSQQDNNVDSTSSIKDKTEDPKQDDDDGGGSGEGESDVLSINADTCDSDIDGTKGEEEQNAKPAETATEAQGEEGSADPAIATITDPPTPEGPPVVSPPAEKELETDIDKSVSEILASAAAAEEAPELNPGPLPPPLAVAPLGLPVGGVAGPDMGTEVCQPSLQQLELLELEMRARAIKALMKASNGKKPS